MSKATKRKHVLREEQKDFFAPPSEGQSIVRILHSRGNNLHEVEGANHETYLASMPTKFRKNIWVKRGDFVIVEPIGEGDKVKAEMVRVLSKEHIKYFKKLNAWPTSFEINVDETGFRNHHSFQSDSSTSSSEEEDDDDDDEDESTSDEDWHAPSLDKLTVNVGDQTSKS